MKDSRGFTILELLIVIAIMTFVASVATKSVSNIEVRLLNKASLQLQNDIRNARNMSVIGNARYRINFVIGSNQYLVRRLGSNGYTKTMHLPDGVYLMETNAPDSTIEYTSTGTVVTACTLTLESKGYAVNLTINVGSGRITVKEFVKLQQ